MLLNLQEWIHKLEMGQGFRYMRTLLLILAILGLVLGYDTRCFRNFNAPEAMDSAQLARNLAEGKGYTTQFVRPVSIHLLTQRAEEKYGVVQVTTETDHARLKSPHPDLANPPVYPLLLAGLMKVAPFKFQVDLERKFWSAPHPSNPQAPRVFLRHQPDFFIGLFNQVLFFVVIALTFLLARRLFDQTVAWLVAALMLGSEMLWRFSVSGLSTMLLLLVFMGLAWVMVLFDAEMREPRRGFKFALLLAIAAGAVVAFGTLTRYAFGWLIVPVVAYLAVFGGARRGTLSLSAVGIFCLLVAPWLYRNYQLCGLPFGTATYAPLEATFLFPEFRLARSLDLDFNKNLLLPIVTKFLGNLREILLNDILRLGGSWATPFFLVGLMLGFRNPALRRLRYFLLGTLTVLIMAQALCRTSLSDDSREINSEYLIILVFPLVLMFAVSLFFVLLDQINFIAPAFRYIVIGLFVFLMTLPMIATLMPPRIHPVAYPPYAPPVIQQTAGFMKEGELMMSDIPWAVAWYGNRQCLWLTLTAQQDFFAVNDLMKPIRGLYLTPLTMDSRFLSQWVRAGEHSWGSFVLESMLRKELPQTFPLRVSPSGYLPEQLFLTDWERWRMPGSSDSTAIEE